jgi:hypothetical protein
MNLSSFLYRFFVSANAELHLPPKPTTTPIPNVYTTVKPRRPKQHNHREKTHHENKGKDIIGPNQIQREIDVNLQSEGKIETLCSKN